MLVFLYSKDAKQIFGIQTKQQKIIKKQRKLVIYLITICVPATCFWGWGKKPSLKVQPQREKMCGNPIFQQRSWFLRAGHSRDRTDQSSHAVLRKHRLESQVNFLKASSQAVQTLRFTPKSHFSIHTLYIPKPMPQEFSEQIYMIDKFSTQK